MNRVRIQLVLSLILILLVATVAGLGLERKVRSFQPLGFVAERVDGSFAVTEVTDPATGLAAGDRIVLVGPAEAVATSAAELAKNLRQLPETTLVVERGVRLIDVIYQRPGLDFDFPFLLLALSGLTYLLIGLYTLLRQRAGHAYLFCLWCIASAALYLLTPVGPPDTVFQAVYFLDELARVLLAPLTLHLFLTFPSPVGKAGARKALPFLYLPAAFLLALQADLALWEDGGWPAFRPPEPAPWSACGVSPTPSTGWRWSTWWRSRWRRWESSSTVSCAAATGSSTGRCSGWWSGSARAISHS